jgi:starch phosphorylase
MQSFQSFEFPYTPSAEYQQRVAYFSMEFGIDQALKIYSGGLGYLAGSHMRSGYDLKQNMVGIGMLWKYGYYDQVRKENNDMGVLHRDRLYNFLVDTDITFSLQINGHPINVRAFYLPPEVFGTVPMFFLTTDLPENDWLARSISYRLYDSNTEAKIAQSIVLGRGGAKLLDELSWRPDTYHFNEAHALSAAFYLYEQYKDVEEVRNRVVFTTHTPVEAGNEKHDIHLLDRLGFFGGLSIKEVRKIAGIEGDLFNQTLIGLRFARIANGVSKMHGEVAREMWGDAKNICPITHITNSQNHRYWHDPELDRALENDDLEALRARKRVLKEQLFARVADQTGNIFDPDVLTVVWARRFARYKRADLLTHDWERFMDLVNNQDRPIQIIWAGKPYPKDFEAISVFNKLIQMTRGFGNLATVTGYELELSKLLKQGSDVWLNTPRITREASGTSGMTAAMNASVNLSALDGWIPEFAKHGHNSFVVPAVDHRLPLGEQDRIDRDHFFQVLENEVLPTYYEQPHQWWQIVANSMRDVRPFFDSDRMADEYYQKLYATHVVEQA